MIKPNSLNLPKFFKQKYSHFESLTPIQEKTVNAGLLKEKSILACAPTASGKTLVATMAIANILKQNEEESTNHKTIYLVPLKALASEKYKEYQSLLTNTPHKVAMATGDIDSPQPFLEKADLLILTTEKLDSLMRHSVSWLKNVKTVVIDEIHLLNDPSRGPTLEIVLTILKERIKPQLIGLSATIGNPEVLASWLDATLVQDSWRPVTLKKGTYINKELKFY